MPLREIRALLRSHFGSRKYRINHLDEIHVFGEYPNAIGCGWYLFGWTYDKDTLDRLSLLR